MERSDSSNRKIVQGQSGIPVKNLLKGLGEERNRERTEGGRKERREGEIEILALAKSKYFKGDENIKREKTKGEENL